MGFLTNTWGRCYKWLQRLFIRALWSGLCCGGHFIHLLDSSRRGMTENEGERCHKGLQLHKCNICKPHCAKLTGIVCCRRKHEARDWNTEFFTFYTCLWLTGSHFVSPLFLRSILECEKLVKATYRKNGLVYRESSSEDEGGGGGVLSSEVIEIDDDDDDDVIAVGCCKSCYFLMRSVTICCYYDQVI